MIRRSWITVTIGSYTFMCLKGSEDTQNQQISMANLNLLARIAQLLGMQRGSHIFLIPKIHLHTDQIRTLLFVGYMCIVNAYPTHGPQNLGISCMVSVQLDS